jgi:hypothetical protein
LDQKSKRVGISSVNDDEESIRANLDSCTQLPQQPPVASREVKENDTGRNNNTIRRGDRTVERTSKCINAPAFVLIADLYEGVYLAYNQLCGKFSSPLLISN